MSKIEGYYNFGKFYRGRELKERLSFIQFFETSSINASENEKRRFIFCHEIPSLTKESHDLIFKQVQKYLSISDLCEYLTTIEATFLKVDDEQVENCDFTNRYYSFVTADNTSPITTYLASRENVLSKEIINYFYQTVEAIHVLHKNDVVHANINPSTVRIFEDSILRVKLSPPGFGFSNFIELLDDSEFLDPECFANEEFNKASDIFSIATIFRNLISDSKGNILEEYRKDYPGFVKEIKKCTLIDSDLRPTAKSLLEFFETIGIKKKEDPLKDKRADEKFGEKAKKPKFEEEEEEGEKKKDDDKLKKKSDAFEYKYRDDEFDREYSSKIICIGDSAVGKTSIIRRYTQDKYSDNYKCTIGVDFAVKRLQIDKKKKLSLKIWDTAGQERFGCLTGVYYRGSECALIMFDVTTRGSFENACTFWFEDFKKKSDNIGKQVIVLVGNKADLVKLRKVSREEAEKFCKSHGIHYFEVSAKLGTNIDKLFGCIAKKLIRKSMKSRQPEQLAYPEKIDIVEVHKRGRKMDGAGGGGCCIAVPVLWIGEISQGFSNSKKEQLKPVQIEEEEESDFESFENEEQTKTVGEGRSEVSNVEKKEEVQRSLNLEQEGLKNRNNYKTISIIGQGGQASVYLVESKENKKLLALKRFKQGINDEEFDNEVFALKELSKYENIVKYVESFSYVDNYGELNKFIVMEYCENGDLSKYIRRNRRKQEESLKYLKFVYQILKGLRSIHEEGFVHHDLKPSNIFITKNMELRIGDFGFAVKSGTPEKSEISDGKAINGSSTSNSSPSSHGGTLKYMCKEQRSGEFGKYYLDIYSLGITLIEMAVRKLDLFQIRDIQGFLENRVIVHPLFQNSLKDCVRSNPLERPDCNNLLKCVNQVVKLFSSEELEL